MALQELTLYVQKFYSNVTLMQLNLKNYFTSAKFGYFQWKLVMSLKVFIRASDAINLKNVMQIHHIPYIDLKTPFPQSYLVHVTQL